ncbi:hypothetical protein GCM10022223_03080 [Kineosporia mesophila]|uniref:Uncharacterized protein n=1 Tax=Kineosporia mesophila TaxID=566012 RepID=A0ABP6YYQ2_9ACTN|nr:hypothetical protein [Kineosporia mesophila]MCD5351794.1 hypothetical protein [Kineosporia mesophila]
MLFTAMPSSTVKRRGSVGRALAQHLAASVATRMQLVRGRDGDRGDVPGWVLVTLMTAGLVVALWGAAGPRLVQVFNDAVDNVVGGP